MSQPSDLEKLKIPESISYVSKYDPYRDSVLRLFGYTHIIGQKAENLVCRANFTNICTGISVLYCACDVYDKFSKAAAEEKKKPIVKPKNVVCLYGNSKVEEPRNDYKPYIAAGNAVVWQSLASFIIPAFAVNRITYTTRRILCRLNAGKLKYYLPPIIGILSLPIIMTPIDLGVTKLIEISQTKRANLISDSYRDTYLRFLGYAFVMSRTAYRGLHNKRQLVDLCYGISVLYCFADAIDKCNSAYEEKPKNKRDKKIDIDFKKKTIITAVDVLIWQGLASFLLPGYVLGGVKYFLRKSIRRVKIHGRVRRMMPAVLALALVPFIIIPIDRIVDELLEHTYRKLF